MPCLKSNLISKSGHERVMDSESRYIKGSGLFVGPPEHVGASC